MLEERQAAESDKQDARKTLDEEVGRPKASVVEAHFLLGLRNDWLTVFAAPAIWFRRKAIQRQSWKATFEGCAARAYTRCGAAARQPAGEALQLQQGFGHPSHPAARLRAGGRGRPPVRERERKRERKRESTKREKEREKERKYQERGAHSSKRLCAALLRAGQRSQPPGLRSSLAPRRSRAVKSVPNVRYRAPAVAHTEHPPAAPKPHSASATAPRRGMARESSTLTGRDAGPENMRSPDQIVTDMASAPPPQLSHIRARAEALRKRSAGSAASHGSGQAAAEPAKQAPAQPHPPRQPHPPVRVCL
jgi:hypothetical protein